MNWFRLHTAKKLWKLGKNIALLGCWVRGKHIDFDVKAYDNHECFQCRQYAHYWTFPGEQIEVLKEVYDEAGIKLF